MSDVILIEELWPTRLPEDLSQAPLSQLLSGLGVVDQSDLTGVLGLLPLGARVYRRLRQIVQHAHEEQGFREVMLPVLQSRRIWEQSDRWTRYAGSGALFTIGDEVQATMCLGPTSEEISVLTVSRHLRSYRDLPIRIWQTTPKFRNELSPRDGLIRSRQFDMTDGYSFDATASSAEDSFERLVKACRAALRRMGFEGLFAMDADGGDITEYRSTELLVLNSQGQSLVIACEVCGAVIEAKGQRGQTCLSCGETSDSGVLKGLELAHVFILGQRYSSTMGLSYVNEAGLALNPYMSCSGIGLTRCLHALAESRRDTRGIAWPSACAPFDVHMIVIDPASETASERRRRAESILSSRDRSVLVDDSAARSVGKRFALADALGAPIQLIIGTGDDTTVELRARSDGRPMHVPIEGLHTALDLLERRSA